MKYGHILSALAEHPWAITHQKFAEIVELLEFRANGGILSDEQIQARIGGGQKPQTDVRGSVAVVPLHGAIYPRANMMTEISGGVSLDVLTGQMAQLMADPSVGSIVLDVDSPGGSVVGVQEFAEKLRAWRRQKPITAVANHLMASAAAWIGMNASEVVASKSAGVGSVGVYMTHVDRSKAYEQAGVKVRILSAGKHKAEGHDHEPLSAEAEAHLMERINEVYGWMVRDIAKGRGVSPERVRGGYGEGRVLGADKALAEGMIDRIGSLDDVIREHAKGKLPAVGMKAEDETPFILDADGATADAITETIAAESDPSVDADERARWNIL